MKIKNIFLAILAIAAIAGCKDDDNNTAQFSKLSPEEHKENIEESGLNVVSQFDELKDMKAIHVVSDFMDLMEQSSTMNSGAVAVLKPVAALESGSSVAFDLKASTVDHESLSQVYKDEAGIFEYNSTTHEWDKKSDSSSEITYKFTSASTGESAVITIDNFNTTLVSNPDLSDMSDELPESVDAKLLVNGNQLMGFEFRASYDSDNLPLSVSEEIMVEKFKITSSVSRSSSKVNFDQSFTYDGANIISSHFESSGSFDYSNINNNMDNDVDIDNQSVVNSSNAWVSVDNLKVEGAIDWKGIGDESDNVEDSLSDEEQWAKDMADLMNNNVKLHVKYHDTNRIIADSEFYAYKKEYDNWDQEYWEYNIRMKFNDGSYMDDSFFTEDNFADFIADVDDLISAMEENF